MGVAELVMKLPERARVLPILLGAVIIHMSLGTYHTFGNMLPYMASYIRNRTDPTVHTGELMWIPTMQGCFPFAMIIGGVISHRLGPRIAAALGCTIMSMGVFLSSYTINRSLLTFMLTYGLMFGFGQGIAYVVAVSTVINWAPHRVGLVSGIVAAGFGVSSSIFTPIQTELVNPWNYSPGSDGYFHNKELLDRVPVVFRTLSLIYVIMQTFGLIFICDPPQSRRSWSSSFNDDEHSMLSTLLACFSLTSSSTHVVQMNSVDRYRTSDYTSVRYSNLKNTDDDDLRPLTKVRQRSQSRESLEEQEGMGRRRRSASSSSEDEGDVESRSNNVSMSPSEVLRSSTFLALFAALFCCSFYANTFYNLYKTFAEGFIEDDWFLAFAFSLGSVANAAARIAWGQLTDKTSFQTALSIACCAASALLLTMPMTPMGGKLFFIVWLVLLFICMAATHALFITAIVKCFGPKHKSVNYGFLILSTTLSGISLSLFSQYALENLGYNWLFLVTALFPFLAFAISSMIGLTPQGRRITE